MIQRIKDLSWPAVALIVAVLAFVAVVLIFAPQDLLAPILAPSFVLSVIAALHLDPYRKGTRSSTRPPPLPVVPPSLDPEDTRPEGIRKP